MQCGFSKMQTNFVGNVKYILFQGRKAVGRSQSFLGTGVSDVRRRHNSLQVGGD